MQVENLNLMCLTDFIHAKIYIQPYIHEYTDVNEHACFPKLETTLKSYF